MMSDGFTIYTGRSQVDGSCASISGRSVESLELLQSTLRDHSVSSHSRRQFTDEHLAPKSRGTSPCILDEIRRRFPKKHP